MASASSVLAHDPRLCGVNVDECVETLTEFASAGQPCFHARLPRRTMRVHGRSRLLAQVQPPLDTTALSNNLLSALGSLPVVGSAVRAYAPGTRDEEDEDGIPKQTIPGPTPLPGGLGSSLDVLRLGGLHKAFQQYHEDFGPVCKVQIGSDSTFILVTDPELTRQVTMSDFDKYRNRNDPGGGDGGALEASEDRQIEVANMIDDSELSLAERGGVGVVAARDEKWKALRSTAISSFGSPKLMPEYARVVAEEAASLVRRLQGYGRGDYLEMQHQPVVDVYRWSRRLTTEVIARIAFSKSLGLVSGKASSEGAGGLGADKTEAMAESLQRFLGNAGRVGRYQPLAKALERLTNASPALPNLQVPVPGLEELEADTKVLDAYEKALIAERRGEEAASGEGAQDLLSKMMRTHVPAPGGRAGEQPRKLSDADVQANVREAFVAGSETTGAAIAITLHQISSNPRIEWLVREELRRVLQGRRLPTYQDLDKLVYLKLCIRETLRLYPSAHVFGRKAEEETLLGGYLIPKGSSLLLSPYYLGRDQTQWGPDAHLFRPERHLPSDPLASTRSKFAWLPFGAGPRMCLGASLAMTEATIATAAMLANFKLLPASKRFSYDYLITIELEQGLPMRLQPLFDHPIQVQRGPAALVQPQPRAPSPPPATPSSTPPLD